MAWLRIADALKAPVGSGVTVKGWVRTRRDSKADGGLSFVEVHDGSGALDAISGEADNGVRAGAAAMSVPWRCLLQ